MKKIIQLILIFSFIFSIIGCSGFLDADTPSVVTDTYYDTKQGQEKLLVSMYSRYRDVYNTGELQYYGTDLYMAITESPSERMFNGYDKTFNSTAPVIGGYWKNLYKIVQESNILINRCTPEIAGNDYDKMQAEGRFLRSLAYYYLVETFGDVPFYMEENKDIIKETTRTPEESIYTFLIEELENIKGKLSLTSPETGVINNASVVYLLGKLYLTRAYKDYGTTSDFSKAVECFDWIIDSQQEYQLLDDYASVYDENNQNNKEVIWAIQYGNDKNFIGGGNPQQQLFGFNIVALEPTMFGKEQADYSSMNRMYWVIPKVHELFTYPELDTRYDVTFKREFYVNKKEHTNYGELGVYFPRWNDQSGDDMGALKYYPFMKNDNYNWLPQSTALPVLSEAIDRMPIIQKFKDTKMDWGGAGTREDVIIRLSDTYLLSAEAYLGVGNEKMSLDRLNTLRRRAAIDNEAFENKLKLKEVTLDIILDERARELLGDHDRWFDLKRTKKLINRTLEYNPFVLHYNNINKDHLVRPIPQDEINKVKGLEQNTGY